MSLSLQIFFSLFFLALPLWMLAEECPPQDRFDGKKLLLTREQWKERLTPEQFRILREGGTEIAFQNAYWDNHDIQGIYHCAGCNLPLFRSQDQYDSGTGWPSFTRPICKENVTLREESSWLGLVRRTEVLCSRCEGHLGHVFPDGPPPTGMRYCMNSGAMKFVRSASGPKEETQMQKEG